MGLIKFLTNALKRVVEAGEGDSTRVRVKQFLLDECVPGDKFPESTLDVPQGYQAILYKTKFLGKKHDTKMGVEKVVREGSYTNVVSRNMELVPKVMDLSLQGTGSEKEQTPFAFKEGSAAAVYCKFRITLDLLSLSSPVEVQEFLDKFGGKWDQKRFEASVLAVVNQCLNDIVKGVAMEDLQQKKDENKKNEVDKKVKEDLVNALNAYKGDAENSWFKPVDYHILTSEVDLPQAVTRSKGEAEAQKTVIAARRDAMKQTLTDLAPDLERLEIKGDAAARILMNIAGGSTGGQDVFLHDEHGKDSKKK